MSTVWRWLSKALMLLLLCVLVLAAIWWYGRLTSPTAVQREAMEVMEAQPPLAEGENGLELLFALPEPPSEPFPNAIRCDEATPCIAAIESAPEANAAAIEAWRPRLEAAQRALRAPVYRETRMAFDFTNALPSYQDTTSLDTLRAFEFASGNTAGALSGACLDASAARRWATEPDTLIQAMLGIAIFRQHASLIADMRQRAPSDPLPASCAALAEAPDAAVEGSLCPALRGEYRYQARMLPSLLEQGEAVATTFERAGMRIGSDLDSLLGMSAESFAGACTEEAAHAAREDRAVQLQAPTIRWVDHVSNPTGATLMEISVPAYRDYFERQLDHVARRRLLAALLQMDVMDAELTPQQRFAALPDDLRNGPRPLVLTEDGRTMTVQIRGHRSDDQEPNGARLPLRLSPAAASAEPTEPAPVQ